MTAVVRKMRCAIYTRKSTEEGLEMDYNSLDAQRDACRAYIASQKSEGWVALRDNYDDGGFSGGTLNRPGVQRLLEDVREGDDFAEVEVDGAGQTALEREPPELDGLDLVQSQHQRPHRHDAMMRK